MISLNETMYTTPKNFNENYKNDSLVLDLKNKLDNSDILILSKLDNLKTSLSSSNLNLSSIKEQVNELSNFNKTKRYEYLNNLLHPEMARGSKIPSQVPVPSCSFQLHNCVTLKTNSSGTCAMMLNPFFLANADSIGQTDSSAAYTFSSFLSTLWVNNDVTLAGNGPNDHWIPQNFSQCLPPVYDQYRLVSAAVQIRYIGRLDSASGVVGGAIILEDLHMIGGNIQETQAYNPATPGDPLTSPDLAKFGNFELARDSYYHKENSCLEGIRMLYFPIDNSYEEYTAIVNGKDLTVEEGDNNNEYVSYNTKSGFNWFFFSQGGPESATCFKVDIFCNFECLPNAKFLNYMPISAYPFAMSTEEKKKCMLLLQQKPLTTLKEESEDDASIVPNIFLKMIKKFKNGLPSLDRLRAWGLINAIPGLTSGLALAGNMIATNSMMDYE